MRVEKGKVRAPEIGRVWLNSPPLSFRQLRGRVVLVDFWDYTCVNCIRTLPYVQAWHERYVGKGLTVIGVHTPEFTFAQYESNVERGVREFGLTYPIVVDNDREIWKAFANRYWPTKYLLDKDGYLRYAHFGEGAYRETEEVIRELLLEANSSLAFPPLMEPVRAEDREGAVCYPPQRRALSRARARTYRQRRRLQGRLHRRVQPSRRTTGKLFLSRRTLGCNRGIRRSCRGRRAQHQAALRSRGSESRDGRAPWRRLRGCHSAGRQAPRPLTENSGHAFSYEQRRRRKLHRGATGPHVCSGQRPQFRTARSGAALSRGIGRLRVHLHQLHRSDTASRLPPSSPPDDETRSRGPDRPRRQNPGLPEDASSNHAAEMGISRAARSKKANSRARPWNANWKKNSESTRLSAKKQPASTTRTKAAAPSS